MNDINWVVAQPLIGGMPIGFEQSFGVPPKAIITAGFQNDEHYIHYQNEVHQKNIPIINMNLTYTEFLNEESEILFNSLIGNVNCLMHVAVCAGLSMLNSSNEGSKARGSADNDQNKNMFELSELGFRLQADTVVFENAPGAYTKMGKETIDVLQGKADAFGYSTHLLKTDTIFHGVPQKRTRTFISFYKNSNPPIFEYEHKKMPVLSDYLSDLNEDLIHYDHPGSPLDLFYEFVLDYTNSENFIQAKTKLRGDSDRSVTSLQLTADIGFEEAIKYFKDRMNSSDEDLLSKAIKISEHCNNKVKAGKGYWDSSLILTNDGKFTNAVVGKSYMSILHPTEERTLNLRELMHLMGLPHDFNLVHMNPHHITQNVPVKTAKYIADQLSKYIRSELNISEAKFVKQDNTKQRIDEGSLVSTLDW